MRVVQRFALMCVPSLACLTLVSGCGDLADQDLCGQYADLVTATEELRAQDPLTATADDLRARADAVSAELDQLQAVSEGQLDTAISTMRAAVNDLRQAAVTAGEDALETARPQIEDAAERIDEAWAVLEAVAEVKCPEDQ